jgi:hypothetical protein
MNGEVRFPRALPWATFRSCLRHLRTPRWRFGLGKSGLADSWGRVWPPCVYNPRMATRDSKDATARKRCLGCGYILDGLPENRCPECGRQFDPESPGTFLVEAESARPYLLTAVLAVLGVLLPPFVLPRLVAAEGWLWGVANFGIVAIWSTSVVVAGVVLVKGTRALWRPRHLFRSRLWLVTAVILVAALFWAGTILILMNL